MTSFNFHDLLNDINSGWPQHFEASLLPSIGYALVDGVSQHYNNPHGYVRIGFIQNTNEQFKRCVLIRDTSTGGCPDKYTVHIHLSDGMYISKGESIQESLDSYIIDRMSELKDGVPLLGNYPIDWEYDKKTINDSNIMLYIRGTVYIPVSDIESDKLELGDVSKLLVSGMNLVQHPNHHDSYLKLNRLGYCNDSWTVPGTI